MRNKSYPLSSHYVSMYKYNTYFNKKLFNKNCKINPAWFSSKFFMFKLNQTKLCVTFRFNSNVFLSKILTKPH